MLSIYFAGGWFTPEQQTDIRATETALRKNPQVDEDGVFFPEYLQNKTYEYGTTPWANHQFNTDIEAMKRADVIVATLTQGQEDPGTAFEIGWAYANNTPVVLVVPNSDSVNLMPAMGNTYITTDPKELETLNFANIPYNEWKKGLL